MLILWGGGGAGSSYATPSATGVTYGMADSDEAVVVVQWGKLPLPQR